MAGDAAIVLEQLVAALFLRRDGIALPAQVAVEARIGRYQRALEGRKGIQHVSRRGIAAIDRGEGLPVGRIGAQFGEQLCPGRVHEMGIEQVGGSRSRSDQRVRSQPAGALGTSAWRPLGLELAFLDPDGVCPVVASASKLRVQASGASAS